MINVLREANSPTSLTTLEIQQYITDIQGHLTDPVNVPKPAVPGSYRNSDLLAAFDRCFHSKCYLTEQWFPNSWCMDVEHFVSQNEDPTKRYAWTNLYPAEHRANKMKPRATPVGGYLDPCDPADDVESDIFYSVGVMGQFPKFDPRDPANAKAVNTTNLLNDLHNGHDEDTRLATAGLRHEIQKKYDLILHLIIEWLGSPVGSPLKHQYENQLRLHLSRKSSFTMLMRSMVSVINKIPAHILD
jgi:hypothetical protein